MAVGTCTIEFKSKPKPVPLFTKAIITLGAVLFCSLPALSLLQ
jgi:hypothetical protein